MVKQEAADCDKVDHSCRIVAASMAADEAILIQKTMEDLGIPQSPVPLLCDNTAAEALLKNPIETGRTKYLEIHWHYVRGLIDAKKVEVFRVDTKSQLELQI
jgi:hypothetical protein